MSKNINIGPKALLPRLKKLWKAFFKHETFVTILVVLAVYLFVVLRISQLAGAEPQANTDEVAAAAIPKVDKNAISQIQSLENSNTQIRSLFDSARNNPFKE
jgi:cell division protein FtsN